MLNKPDTLVALEAAAKELSRTVGISLPLARGMVRHALVSVALETGCQEIAIPYLRSLGFETLAEFEARLQDVATPEDEAALERARTTLH